MTAALWVLTALTAIATIYWGWHYILDDVGGLVIAVAALALARVITGIDLRTARERRRSTAASSSAATPEPEMVA